MREQLLLAIRALRIHPTKGPVLQRFQQRLDSGDLTTPQRQSANLQEFCRSLADDCEPEYVNVDAPPWSRLDCCDLNVRKLISQKGGSIVMGHKIWAIDDYYFEAVPHAVWRNPGTEALVDVTFNVDGEKRILFLRNSALDSVRQISIGEKRRGVFESVLREFWELQQAVEQRITVVRPSDAELWEKCLTYTEWKKRRTKKT